MAGRTRTLDELPLLPREITVHQFSSHNKKGVNGDAGWSLYKDQHGDSVIFDAMGPGCVKSMWGTAIPADQVVKFYFDGEATPRYSLKATDLYSGKTAPFVSPLSFLKVIGRYEGPQSSANCFVPMPFAKSLKVAVTGEVTFYHILYERYPTGTELRTFTGTEDRSYLRRAFAQQGEELLETAGGEVVRAQSDGIPANGTLDVLSLEKPGVVKRLVVEGDGSEELLQHVELEMRWDDPAAPDVIAPLGMLYACPVRAENVRALPLKVEKLADGQVRLTSYFRMPFWHKASIRLVNRGAQATGPVRAEVTVAPQSYAEGEAGYFSTQYRAGRTVMGRDWPFFEAQGTGWFVGAVQTMLGGHYCEGDEHFTVDGAAMPQINGTGTEDYYLACFWPNVNFNLPFAGCVGDVFAEGGGFYGAAYRRTGCYYRFHLEAPIPFYSGISACIQHGGASDIVSQYSSLGFGYLRRRPALSRTDLLDVGNEQSERDHGYSATESKPTGDLEASYEGENLHNIVRDSGRSHRGGEIRFTVAVRPENGGVRLRRRLDQKSPRQSAEVFVNGGHAGTWYHADENPYLRWYDSDFDIAPQLTQGKRKLDILLVVSSEEGRGEFTDFRYEVFTCEPPNTVASR
ncbi:MAG TPA: DUF2961 domain-containing protein [Armatimonadota bacterium]